MKSKNKLTIRFDAAAVREAVKHQGLIFRLPAGFNPHLTPRFNVGKIPELGPVAHCLKPC